MLEWVDRDVLVDVSVNAVPLVILAYFVVLTLVWTPWPSTLADVVVTQTMHLVPIVVLGAATYYAARAVERDAGGA